MKIIFQMIFICSALCLLLFAGCSEDETTEPKPEKLKEGDYRATQAAAVPKIDGKGDEECWTKADWAAIDKLWLGSSYTESDFTGRYKAVWSKEKLYLLVEIIDDVLMDSRPDPLNSYWEDDCLEIFIDEDNSDGNHQNNYNAFAYHVSVFYDAVDLGTDGQAHLYNDNLNVFRSKSGTLYTWEFEITIYDDSFVYGAENNKTAELTEGKKMGFAIAYCDSDLSKQRENFIGTMDIPGTDKNLAWIDAGVFGTMELVK
ncbi:CBM9 family sugar-binding protein [candidate division KSB1 bacterium]|nr:CBM9 family sugar-binding protein [candidate division KSB1 bacterium]